MVGSARLTNVCGGKLFKRVCLPIRPSVGKANQVQVKKGGHVMLKYLHDLKKYIYILFF